MSKARAARSEEPSLESATHTRRGLWDAKGLLVALWNWPGPGVTLRPAIAGKATRMARMDREGRDSQFGDSASATAIRATE